jgi:hypothetical protein
MIARTIDAGELVTQVGAVLPLAAARLAHKMLEGTRSRPAARSSYGSNRDGQLPLAWPRGQTWSSLAGGITGRAVMQPLRVRVDCGFSKPAIAKLRKPIGVEMHALKTPDAALRRSTSVDDAVTKRVADQLGIAAQA